MSDQRGFTLIELLVVISIIGLLSSVVGASVATTREKGRVAAARHFDAQVQHIAWDSVIANYNFNECAGSTLTDSSGTGNNGTISGATWSTDTYSGTGCSLDFDGVNDYVSIPRTTTLDMIDNFTITAWVKPRSTAGQAFLMKGDSAAAFAYGWSTNGFQFIAWNSVNAPYAPRLGTDLNKWNQLVGVVEDGVRTFYLNGVKTGIPAGGAGLSRWSTASNIYIGANQGTGNFANALIDDVRIYAKTLTAREVGQLYAKERGRGEMFANGQLPFSHISAILFP
jgi:prepilin-type N-terminal cleavage/methylation domain-containing protein